MSTTLRSPERVERVFPIRVVAEERIDGTELRLRGYAAVFGSPSEDIGFIEHMQRGCFRQALARPDCDVLFYWSHDRSRPLARQSAGNLRLWEDERGLAFEATLVATQIAQDAIKLVRAGVVKGMSFGFTVRRDRWGHGDPPKRFVEEVEKLFEISLVTEPAYAATSVEGRSHGLADLKTQAKAEVARRRVQVNERTPYGAESKFSWFGDLSEVSETIRLIDARAKAGLQRHGPMQLRDYRLDFAGSAHREMGGAEDARRRLLTVHRRDIGSAQLSALIDGVGVPEFVVATFREATRAKAAVANVLTRDVLPPGMIIPAVYKSGRLTTGSSVAIQSAELGAVSETDPDDTTADIQPGTIAGQVDPSRQLLDRGIGTDIILARELGAAYGERLDVQIINGSGSSGQLLGLLNVPGVTLVTYTDGTPSGPELQKKVWQCSSDVATAVGYGPTELLVLHPRRAAWLQAEAQGATASGFVPDLPGRSVEAAAVPITLGGSSNEDRIVVISSPSEVVLLDRAPVFWIGREEGAGALTARAQVYSFALLVVRTPAAVGVVAGTGLAGPPAF